MQEKARIKPEYLNFRRNFIHDVLLEINDFKSTIALIISYTKYIEQADS